MFASTTRKKVFIAILLFYTADFSAVHICHCEVQAAREKVYSFSGLAIELGQCWVVK